MEPREEPFEEARRKMDGVTIHLDLEDSHEKKSAMVDRRLIGGEISLSLSTSDLLCYLAVRSALLTIRPSTLLLSARLYNLSYLLGVRSCQDAAVSVPNCVISYLDSDLDGSTVALEPQ